MFLVGFCTTVGVVSAFGFTHLSVDKKVLVERLYKNDHRLTRRASGARLSQYWRKKMGQVSFILLVVKQRFALKAKLWYMPCAESLLQYSQRKSWKRCFWVFQLKGFLHDSLHHRNASRFPQGFIILEDFLRDFLYFRVSPYFLRVSLWYRIS
jgi:hypothetical protein